MKTTVVDNPRMVPQQNQFRRRQKRPKFQPSKSVEPARMDKQTWKATFRELFLMLLIAAVTAGMLMFFAPYL